MAAVPKFSNTCVNAEADAIGNALNNGYIRLYDGSQPANADTAVGAQVLLAELRFGADAFPAASAGLLTANAITDDSSANATGTATWEQAAAEWSASALQVQPVTGTAAWEQAPVTWGALLHTPDVSAGVPRRRRTGRATPPYQDTTTRTPDPIFASAAFIQPAASWRAVVDVSHDPVELGLTEELALV